MRRNPRLCLLALFLLSLAPQGHAVPAPTPRTARAKPPPAPVGVWQVDWGGQPGAMRFDARGAYSCVLGETVWVGTWDWDAAGVLHVKEVNGQVVPDETSACWCTWHVSLSRDRTGRLSGKVVPFDVCLSLSKRR